MTLSSRLKSLKCRVVGGGGTREDDDDGAANLGILEDVRGGVAVPER